MILKLLACCLSLSTAIASAQVTGAPIQRDDVPLDEYLRMLELIQPAARTGAEAYLAAVSERCGRQMRTIELRRALADDNGDPVLLQMISASYYRDAAAIQRLSGQVSCPRG